MAAPSSKILEGSGTASGACEAVCGGAVMKFSIAAGTISLILVFGSSAGNSLSCSEIVNFIGPVGGKATNMSPLTGTEAGLDDTAAPGSPGSPAADGGADAGQSANPAPVLTQTIAGATILTAKE